MGRPALFDESEVLDRALEVFWSQGFSDASARALQERIGVHPGSLYHQFGSKEGLFLAVLDHYIHVVVEMRIDAYLGGTDAREGARQFFRTAFDGPAPGCLLNNSATEFGAKHPKVLARVTRGNEMLVAAFRRLLDRDPTFEELSATERARMGESILIAFQGYLVVGKTCTTVRRRDRLVDTVLETLFRRK